MINKWKIASHHIGGNEVYSVYRLIDTSKPDRADNHEYPCGYYISKYHAEKFANELNAKEVAK